MQKILQNKHFQKAKDFYFKYERRIGTAALFFGFILDSLTLQRIDDLFENLIVIFYLILSGFIIFLINIYKSGESKSKTLSIVGPFLPTITQFSFGGLFSAFFIFYSRSGDFSVSWPFILILLFLLIGNEFFKEYYKRQSFQISIYFVAVYSFLIFFIPIIISSVGAIAFVISGLLSIVAIKFFVYIMDLFTKVEEERGAAFFSVGLIFVLINVLYFTNILPPIPISLKDVGVYHLVEREEDGNYLLRSEKESWIESILPGKTIHLIRGNPLYVFSSVFAPTNISSDIVHCWQYKEDNNWKEASCISFPIFGGANQGYRGYSVKQNLFPGEWRVNIETKRGQKIGHIKFKVEEVSKTPELDTKINQS